MRSIIEAKAESLRDLSVAITKIEVFQHNQCQFENLSIRVFEDRVLQVLIISNVIQKL